MSLLSFRRSLSLRLSTTVSAIVGVVVTVGGVALPVQAALAAAPPVVSNARAGVPVPDSMPLNGVRIGGAPGGAQTARGVTTPATLAPQWASPTGNLPPTGGTASGPAATGNASTSRTFSALLGPAGASQFPAPAAFAMATAASQPSARSYPAGAFDAVRNVIVEFGGYSGGTTYRGDTWTFDGSTWTNKAPATAPSARSAASIAFDAATSTTILFGGYNGTSALSDTWSWNGTTWTQLFPAATPPARAQAATAYNAATGTVVMFGGHSGSSDLSDTWSWNGTNWSSVTTPAGLTARSDSALAYDATASKLVLFGGVAGSGTTFFSDTWLYTAAGWTQATPAHDPGPRAGMGLAYDAVIGRTVLYGGVNATSSLADTWLYNGTDWLFGNAPNNAFTRENFLFTQAAVNGQLVLQGGVNFAGSFYGDTTVLDWGALGTPKSATIESRHLDDRSSYGTNVGNGNFIVSATDLSIPGVGVPLSITRRLNTLGGFNGWLGQAWELTNSFDTTWAALPDGSIVLNGVRGAADLLYFKKSGSTFTSPGGIDATLATSGSGYTLTFNASSEKLTFNATGQLTGDADRNGNTITYTWVSGKPSSITDTQGRSYTIGLSGGGQIATITGPGSRVATYVQDSFGDLTKVTDPAGDVTNYTYQSNHFKIATLQDPNLKTTTIAYRLGAGRMGSVTDPQTTPNTLAYDYNPPAAGIGAWFQITSTDANSHNTFYSSNYAGQVVKVTDPLGHNRAATFNANGDQLTSVDAVGVGNTTTYGYDVLNNPGSAQLPTGATGRAYYANQAGFCSTSDSIHPYMAKCVNDAEGDQSTLTYDTPGNLLTTHNVTTGATATNTYNPATPTCGGKIGQLCSTQDGNLHATSYSYDTAGNLTTLTPPSPLGAVTRTYDTSGRVATMTDGKGQKSTYTYDGDDRISQVLLGGATTCTYTAGTCVTFGYDNNGNRTSMHDVTGTTGYGYDVMNRQTSKTLPSGAIVGQTYDHVGNVLTAVDGTDTTTYSYNAADQLTSLAEPTGSCNGTISLCTTFGVDNNGQRTSTTYPGNTVMTTTLDSSGRPTRMKTGNGATTIADFSYTYTKAAADTELAQTRVDNKASLTTTYGYDPKNELTSAVEKNSGGTTTASWLYCYDYAGNRTAYSTTSGATCGTAAMTYTYNAADELTAVNGNTTGWSYDQNGNETAGSSTTPRTSESYTPVDQLSSITTAGSATTSTYAGLTNNERTIAGGTSYQFGTQGLVNQTNSGTTVRWVRDPAGTLISERIGSAHYYYSFDALGSVVALVDGTGVAVNTYSYDPYGVTRASTGATVNPFQYTGAYKDATGLYALGARFYDPALGRFTQQDPSGHEPNAYAYAGNTPVNAVDPTGTWKVTLAKALLKFFAKALRSGRAERYIGKFLDEDAKNVLWRYSDNIAGVLDDVSGYITPGSNAFKSKLYWGIEAITGDAGLSLEIADAITWFIF